MRVVKFICARKPFLRAVCAQMCGFFHVTPEGSGTRTCTPKMIHPAEAVRHRWRIPYLDPPCSALFHILDDGGPYWQLST